MEWQHVLLSCASGAGSTISTSQWSSLWHRSVAKKMSGGSPLSHHPETTPNELRLQIVISNMSCSEGFLSKQGLQLLFPSAPERMEVLFKWPPMMRLLQRTGSSRTSFCLALYGASSLKPLQVVSTTKWTKHLKRSGVRRMAGGNLTTLAKKDGRKVTGKRGTMRASQSYPERFGVECSLLKMRHGF